MEQVKNKWPFYTWMTVIAIGLGIGIFGAAQVLIKGLGLTMAATDQMPWGILAAAYEFFVIMSVGLCLVASIGYVFGVKRFQLIAKRAVLLAIITLLAGLVALFFDMGQPLRMFNFFISPNFTSAMWWLSVLYTLYLIFMLVLFYQLNKEFENVRIVGALALVTGIVAIGTIGALFGFAEARPFFGGALTPVYFIVSALVSGIAILALVTIVGQKVTKREMSPELHSLMTVDMGKLLALVLGIAFFIAIWKGLTGLYSPSAVESDAYRYMLLGSGAFLYWGLEIVIGLIIPFFLVLNPGTRNTGGLLAASSLVLIGMFVTKYNLVFGGQVVPLLQGLWQEQFLSYSPTFVEFSIVILAFAVVALLYTLGNRIFALEEVPLSE